MLQHRSIFLAILFLAYSLYADILQLDENSNLERDRIHSARKAIDQIAKVPVKDVSVVESFKSMFHDGKISGQLRLMYGDYNYKKTATNDTYATAIGGVIKYETASLNGFNGAAAVYTAHDIPFATGKGASHNSELASQSGSYTEMAEAYLNYKYNTLNLRAGRQILNTPLADSDDIRIISNTFEAYILSYEHKGFSFLAGNIQSWQGFDAGLETPWQRTGIDGTNLIGLSYSDTWESNAWVYNITGKTNVIYLDGGISYRHSNTLQLHTMVQFLDEQELSNSGVTATVYGGLFEAVFHAIGCNLAYNKAVVANNKSSFSGTGGGTLFTSMDTMILDNIAVNEDAEALTYGLTYEINNFNLLYANGNFWSNSEAVREQDIQIEYNFNDEFLVATIYAITEDKKQATKTDYDWDRFQFLVNYNF